MRIRFIMPIQAKKVLNNGDDTIFSIGQDRCIQATKVVETDDEEFVDIFVEDGVIPGINKQCIELCDGSIDVYIPPVVVTETEEKEDE